MNKMSLEETIGSLIVQEQRLHECEVREEQQDLLARAMGKEKISLGDDHLTRGCVRGHAMTNGEDKDEADSLNLKMKMRKDKPLINLRFNVLIFTRGVIFPLMS